MAIFNNWPKRQCLGTAVCDVDSAFLAEDPPHEEYAYERANSYKHKWPMPCLPAESSHDTIIQLDWSAECQTQNALSARETRVLGPCHQRRHEGTPKPTP